MNQNVIVEPAVVNSEELGPYGLFRALNSTRPEGHSANKVYEDKDESIIAVRCNCGKKKYHPVVKGVGICWKSEIIEKELSELKKKERVIIL